MMPLREIDVLGVFVAPFSLCLPVAIALTWAATLLLRRVPATAITARSAGVELALFTGILSGLVLLLGRV